MDSELLRLSDLLMGAAPASGAPATPGAATAAPPRPSSAAAAASSATQLSSSLAKELSALDALFARWQADVVAKQRSSARDFPDERSFSLALVVLNKRGERRRGPRAAQEFYFAPRHAASSAGQLACTRCCLHIARRQTYWVDRAAPSWSQADELCRRCLLCVMRGLLGEDDTSILAEAQSILDSAWSPTINAALLEALGGGSRRAQLAEL